MVCKSTGSVENYYNPNGRNPSRLVDASNPSIGISNISITQNGAILICRFQRKKKYPRSSPQYFDLNDEYYVLGAFGDIDDNG